MSTIGAMDPLCTSIETINNLLDPNDTIAAQMRALMTGYTYQWSDAGYETVAIEQTFHLPITNPESGRNSRTFTHAGKYDGLVSRDNKRYLLEHKTCSEEIADPSAPYWRRLAIDSQVSGYVLSQWKCGTKLDGTVYDVIRKPTIRPKAIPKTDAKMIVLHGTYCGQTVDEKVRLAVGAETQTQECAHLYELRLCADIAENPGKYFQRRVVPRLDAEVIEYAHELWDTADEIRLARLNDRHFRNPGACMQYNTPCEFLGLCSGHDTTDSDSWRKKERTHNELDILDDANVLSHSRMQCFRTCRRKHFYQYELGIEPNKEEREALFFGHILHKSLESWWSCFQLEVV